MPRLITMHNMPQDVLFINLPTHVGFSYLPVGIRYLNQILLNAGVKSGILDIQNRIHKGELCYGPDLMCEISNILRQSPAKIFALTVMNTSFPWLSYVAQIIKALYPDSKIIIGGPQATFFWKEILTEQPVIDIVCVFEGEKIILPLVDALLSNGVLHDIPNLAFRRNQNEIIRTSSSSFIEDLDDLPFVDLNISEYSDIDPLTLDVGRGCPYACYFCSTQYLWQRKARFKTPENIVRQAQRYYQKMTEINPNPWFYILLEHDNFLAKPSFIKEFIRVKQELKADFLWGCMGRADNVDDELITLLRSAGCIYIFMGIETGSQRIQAVCKKNLDLELSLTNIKKLLTHGFFVEANFIVGFPEETCSEALQTLTMISEIVWLGGDVNLAIMSPEPNTDLRTGIQSTDFVLMKNSRIYNELHRSGIQPESLDKEKNYHLYTIANRHYDILTMAHFGVIFKDLIKEYPVIFHILINTFNISLADIYAYHTPMRNQDPQKIIQQPEVYFFNMTPLWDCSENYCFKQLAMFELRKQLSPLVSDISMDVQKLYYQVLKKLKEGNHNAAHETISQFNLVRN